MSLTLIDAQDNFEVIRDRIAVLLAAEIANQQVLATAAGKDPADWKIRVYTERANAWEQWLNSQADTSPICNVWYSRSDPDQASSNAHAKQDCTSLYHIDCIACGVSADVPGGGHEPGDQAAALNAHRALRLIRGILMSAENTYLGLRGTVYRRWPQSIETFQPDFDKRLETPHSFLDIVGARLTLAVDHPETSQQVIGEPLEYLSAEIKRASDGAVLVDIDIDYT